MERETIVKTLNGNSTSLLYKSSFVPKNTQKDSSFSPYLKPEPQKDDIVGGNIDDCDQISVFEAENYFNESTDLSKRKSNPTLENSENSLENSRLSSISSSLDGYGRNYKVNQFHSTPTASSEASWNSQTGLLTNPQGSSSVSLRRFSNDSPRRGGSRTMKNWFLMQKCPCFGKKSVQVEEKVSSSASISPIYPKIDPNGHEKRSVESHRSSITTDTEGKADPVYPNFHRFSSDNQFMMSHQQSHLVLRSSFPSNGNGIQFSFPILNANKTVSRIPDSRNSLISPSDLGILDDPPRESLEIFQPPTDPDVILDNARRTRRNYQYPASPMSRIASADDDVASDASSDLFEIESLSTQAMYPRRDSLEDATTFNARRGGVFRARSSVDSVAPTECYAPSEASVEWSVTTAEGFDRGSLANFSASVSQIDFATKFSGGGGGGDGGKWLGMGCRGEKAVSVGRRVGNDDGGAWGDATGDVHAPMVSRVRHVRSGDSDGFCYRQDTIYPMNF